VKLQLIRTGKNAHQGLTPLVADYKKRLSAFVRVDELELKAEQGRDKRTSQKSETPIYSPGPGETLILLDERGKQWTSQAFAAQLQAWIDDPRVKTLTVLAGPPYGFDDATRAVAAGSWSLSPLTLPSDFAWLLAWEQIYRAFTILKGMPYHHD
jgi:23S rRNA (pseudouridine1915-N3)-methyltransferase